MPHIAVILPYAVSIRDFVHSGALGELLSDPDTSIQIYTQNPDLPEFNAVRSGRVSLSQMPRYRGGRIETVLKKLYPLMFHDIFVNAQLNIRRSTSKLLVAKSLVAFRRVVGTGRALRLYGKLLAASSARPPKQIDGEPDLVISTRSLINSLDYPLLLEAARRGLPQLVAASSWDNFTTKGFFPFPVLKTIVWNQQMANELGDIFKVPEDRVVVAGYPRLKSLQQSADNSNAQDYLEQLGLPQYRRFVLYSASYGELTRTNPDEAPAEFKLIQEVATALSATLPDDTCIIVRLHPYSRTVDETFFDGLPRVHLFVPGRRDQYVERVMSEEDERHLSAQLKFSECIISMASTMTIDALALNRPIINLAFDPGGPEAQKGLISRFYRYNHFRDLLKAVKPPLATHITQVIEFVARCISGDKDPGIDRAAFERLYVPVTSLDYSKILRRAVDETLAAGHDARRPIGMPRHQAEA